MSRSVVTGVAGFIGSTLARQLAAAGHRLRGVDNFVTGKRENLAGLDELELLEGDVADPEIARAACRGMEFVFHQAAIPSVPASVADPLACHRANLDATLQLLIAARDAGVRRVVYAASSSAYGDAPSLPAAENLAPAPISPYAVAKLAGEYYLRCFHAVYGLETVCLRYFNVFGPRQDPASPYSGVLAQFIGRMLAGAAPVVYGDGEQSRDFVFVDDVAQANLLAATARGVAGHVFNIASGERVTLNQILAMLRVLTGYQGEVRRQSSRPGDVKHSLADLSLARAHLGYQPRVSFREGLERTVAWYRNSAGDRAGVGLPTAA
ncbi:MAG TPA: SDR family oxidoreductase [Terriglobales bacterium]|nr:SDR family oxidoreductase [Terriglobales bacterium]